MFDELDDPAPPRPSGTTRIRVHARAAKLRRRTNAVRAGTSAVLVLLLVGVLTVFARRDNSEELDTGPVGPVPNTTPVDLERGEVLELDGEAFGGTLVERRTMNDPESGAFEVTLSYDLDDSSTAAVRRIETSATTLAELRAQLGPQAGTVAGRPYYVNPDDPSQLYWFVDDNIAIFIGTPMGSPAAVEQLEELVYVPPEVKCVDGEEIRADGPCVKATLAEPVGVADHSTVDVSGGG